MAETPAVTPALQILRISGGVMLARCVGIAAELALPDLVPATAEDLARKTGSHAGALYRMLRYLAANGIFAEGLDGRFANTPSSEVLRAGVPGSLRDFVRQSWQDYTWDTHRNLPHTIKTGEPAFTKAFGADFFDYLAANPSVGAKFDAAMALQSGPENAAVAAALPVGGAQVVMDVGGGRGGFLAAVLKAYPSFRGILFDQAHVLREAQNIERAEQAAGNFFDSVPGGADLYVLKRILHDWDDPTAIRILRNCAAALKPGARVVAIDAVIKPGNEPDPNKALDMSIMALLKGRERTATEFEQVFAAAGLRMTRIIPTAAPSTMSLIEGVRA